MIKAVLFDMDGLMFDTERMYHDSWLELGRQRGLAMTEALVAGMRGRNREGCVALCKAAFGPEFDFMELRGVGIINARRLFGIGAVKMTEKINMIVQLEQWDATKVYDRMGMNEEYTDVLGVQVSSLTIPVKPGRNLAIIIEVAAMNNRQKRMGYNAAQELLEKLGMVEPDSTQTTDWGDF